MNLLQWNIKQFISSCFRWENYVAFTEKYASGVNEICLSVIICLNCIKNIVFTNQINASKEMEIYFLQLAKCFNKFTIANIDQRSFSNKIKYFSIDQRNASNEKNNCLHKNKQILLMKYGIASKKNQKSSCLIDNLHAFVAIMFFASRVVHVGRSHLASYMLTYCLDNTVIKPLRTKNFLLRDKNCLALHGRPDVETVEALTTVRNARRLPWKLYIAR